MEPHLFAPDIRVFTEISYHASQVRRLPSKTPHVLVRGDLPLPLQVLAARDYISLFFS
jgi:hypothetical protein